MKQKTDVYLVFAFIGLALMMSNCAKEIRNEDLTLEEMKAKAFSSLKKQDYEQAGELLQLIITKFPEDPKIANHKISLANCKFNNTEYESAYQLYENFHQFYPSDKRAEYAKYRAALSKFRQSLEFDRDQTITTHTLQVCKSYQDVGTYQKYRAEINEFEQQCLQKLLDKELSICKFYIKHGKTEAASKRLAQAHKIFSTHKNLDEQLLYLECKLAKKTNNTSLFEEKMSILNQLYAESPYRKMAENLVTKNTKFIF